MRLPNHRQYLKKLRRYRTALLLLGLGAVLPPSYLIHFPQPPDYVTIPAEDYPLQAENGQELQIKLPPGQQLLLRHPGDINENTTVTFDQAELDTASSIKLTQLYQFTPPSTHGLQQMIYSSRPRHPGEDAQWRTIIQIELKKTKPSPAEIHFVQVQNSEFPCFEMHSVGAALRVTLNMEGNRKETDGDQFSPPTHLFINDSPNWDKGITEAPITFIVPTRQKIRFSFANKNRLVPLWDESGTYTPFDFGEASSDRSAAKPTLPVQEVGIEHQPDRPSSAEIVLQSKGDKQPLLRIKSLTMSNANRIDVGVIGKGWIFKEGQPEAVPLRSRMKNHPILSAISLMAGIGLLMLPAVLYSSWLLAWRKVLRDSEAVVAGSPRFDVFLAHNSQDKAAVEAIAEALEQRGLKPWLDKQQIAPGRSFQDEIQAALPNVKSIAIFIGQKGLGKWEALEIKSSISQYIEQNLPVIPVLLPGVDQLPSHLLFLKELNWVRFSENVDEEEAIENLAWGITGKKADDAGDSKPLPAEEEAKQATTQDTEYSI